MRMALTAMTLTLGGCVTPGRAKILLDGVEADQIRQDIWRINVWRNDFTSAGIANDFGLLQIAQTMIVHGGKHFVVLSSATNAPRKAWRPHAEPAFDAGIAKAGKGDRDRQAGRGSAARGARCRPRPAFRAGAPLTARARGYEPYYPRAQ